MGDRSNVVKLDTGTNNQMGGGVKKRHLQSRQRVTCWYAVSNGVTIVNPGLNSQTSNKLAAARVEYIQIWASVTSRDHRTLRSCRSCMVEGVRTTFQTCCWSIDSVSSPLIVTTRSRTLSTAWSLRVIVLTYLLCSWAGAGHEKNTMERERSGKRGLLKKMWAVSGNFHRSRSAHMLWFPLIMGDSLYSLY